MLEASTFNPRLDDAAHHAAFEIHVEEGPQFRMATVEFAGLSDADVNALKRKWRLQPGDVYDDTYPRDFTALEIVPLQRRGGAPFTAPTVKTRVDPQTRTVAVRFVFM